jgi:hypothetical protein
MKNIQYIALAAIAILLSSCAKDGSTIFGGKKIEISGSLPGTKTTFTDKGTSIKVAWNANENILLVDATKAGTSATFSSDAASEGQTSAKFKGVLEAAEGDKIVALYPASLTVTDLSTPIDYSAQDGSLEYIQSKAVMYATSTFSATSTALNFNNAASVLKMNLTMPAADDITSVTISSSDNSLMNKADLNLSGTAAEWKNQQAGNITITFKTAKSVAAGEVLTVYALAVPQTAKGLKIVASNSTNTKEYYYDTQADATFEAGKVNSLTQTLATKNLTTTLVQKSVLVNASQIGVTWSISDYATPATDKADAYIFGIYTDANCTNDDAHRIVRWSSAADATIWKWKNPYTAFPALFDCSPRFVFSGLTPATTYYIKIEDTTKGISSIASYTTNASSVVDMNTIGAGTATAGKVILMEDFSEVVWGGESVARCAGFKPSDVKSPTSFTGVSGDNATDGTTSVGLGACNTGTGYFFDQVNGCGKATQGSRIKNWASWMEDDKSLGMKQLGGIIMIGNSKKCGDLVTAPLAPLSGTATITLEFDAAPYYETGIEPLSYQVHVFDNPTVTDNVIAYATAASQTFEGSIKEDCQWQHVTVEIPNVTATSRIGIGPKIAEKTASGYHRIYLDNIKITVKNY